MSVVCVMSCTWQPGRMGEEHAEPEARGFIDPRLIGTKPHSVKRERNVDSNRHLVGGFFTLKFGPVKREDKPVLEAFSDISAQTLLNLGHVQVNAEDAVQLDNIVTTIPSLSANHSFKRFATTSLAECTKGVSTAMYTTVSNAKPISAPTWVSRPISYDLASPCLTLTQYPNAGLYRPAACATRPVTLPLTEKHTTAVALPQVGAMHPLSGSLSPTPAPVQRQWANLSSLSVPDYYCHLMMTEIGTGNQLNTFPFHVTRVLRDWLCRNLQYPYACPEEKEKLLKMTGLSLHQINYWLTNARRRLVPRLLQYVNSERAKKGLQPITKSRCKSRCKLKSARRLGRQAQYLQVGRRTDIPTPPALEPSNSTATTTASIPMVSPPSSPEELKYMQFQPPSMPASMPMGRAVPLAIGSSPVINSPVVLTAQPASEGAISRPLLVNTPPQFIMLPGYSPSHQQLSYISIPTIPRDGRNSTSPSYDVRSDPPPLEKIES